ncbi:hypothetical protein SADUNF_Sadunf16G0150200 [Salix dunnii]|uniref:Glycosyltransferase n=1 Tax=Salix dunnii TaxID=1413687 RepID=A0A835JEE6_9ROSI|nr:hypothetical protein SADUNF_Sadunf16G0150200 [Salix dunnii]
MANRSHVLEAPFPGAGHINPILQFSRLMEGDRQMKMNSKKWKELAIEATSEGGTSDNTNINEPVANWKKMDREKRERESHVLVLPLPLQGHINPMLQFSKRLESKGLKVTLIITPYIAKSMQGQHSSINLEPIFDGSKEGEMAANIDKYFERYKLIMPHSLSKLIDRYNGTEYPVKFLIYDSVLPWALDVARNKGIEGGPFFTQTFAVTAVLYHAAQGAIQVPIEESDQAAAVSLPSLEKLEFNDLPSFAIDASSYPAIRELLLGQFSNILEARWLIWNSFNELEVEVVDWMRINKWSVKPVGPLIPSMFLDKRLGDDNDYGLNLIKPTSDVCMKWLDSKEPGSVVYVSFGSLAAVGEEQMAELAWGLKRSNRCFLWIVRESEESKLPRDLVKETSGRSLIIKWCPQLQVLAHKSVGCFMTHCGWNSTLEALSIGVPMVAMPQWTDQPTNAKYITDVWRVGVRVKANEKGIVTREEVERCIREVLESERSNAIRGNSDKWSKLAKIAVDAGGSSDKNIEEFVTEVACKSKGIIE